MQKGKQQQRRLEGMLLTVNAVTCAKLVDLSQISAILFVSSESKSTRLPPDFHPTSTQLPPAFNPISSPPPPAIHLDHIWFARVRINAHKRANRPQCAVARCHRSTIFSLLVTQCIPFSEHLCVRANAATPATHVFTIEIVRQSARKYGLQR